MTGLHKIALAFWFVTIALPIVAQTTGKLSRTASSSIRSARDKYGNDVIITTNRRFSFVEIRHNDYRPMVLLEEFQLLARSGLDLYLSKIAIRYQGKLHEDSRHLVSGLALLGVWGKMDKSALSDFSVALTWNDKFEAEIPVENDEIQIGKAKVSDKIILEAAK
jgi:hypothetical protein